MKLITASNIRSWIFLLFITSVILETATSLECVKMLNYGCSCTLNNKLWYNLSEMTPPVVTTKNFFQNIRLSICRPISCAEGKPMTSSMCSSGVELTRWDQSSVMISVDSETSITATIVNNTTDPATAIKLDCDPKMDEANLSQDTSDNSYKLKTKYACWTLEKFSPSLTIGSQILIAILCIMAIYIVVGVTYNHYQKRKSGKYLFPNYEGWTVFFANVIVGCRYLKYKLTNKNSSENQALLNNI